MIIEEVINNQQTDYHFHYGKHKFLKEELTKAINSSSIRWVSSTIDGLESLSHPLMCKVVDTTWVFCHSCNIFVACENRNYNGPKKHLRSENHRDHIIEPEERQQLITTAILGSSHLDNSNSQRRSTSSTLILKRKIAKEFVTMCSLDMAAFNMINNKGFRRFCTFLINQARADNTLNVEVHFPDESTCRTTTLDDLYDETVCTLNKKLSKISKDQLISVTTDLWGDRSILIIT